MIRILIADDLSARIIDRLNEIPEFEIIEKTSLIPEKFATEIKNIDAVVMSGATPLTPAILQDAANLKIIVLTGSGPNHLDAAMALRKNIEIRNTQPFTESHSCAATASSQEREGSDAIAILKDFFNV
jgi:D-3-phosphoglycerate dehydrogenase